MCRGQRMTSLFTLVPCNKISLWAWREAGQQAPAFLSPPPLPSSAGVTGLGSHAQLLVRCLGFALSKHKVLFPASTPPGDTWTCFQLWARV